MQLRLRSSFVFLALIPCLSACPTGNDEGDAEVGETAGTTDETGESDSTADESAGEQGSSESDDTTDLGDTGMESESEETANETDSGTETTGDPSLNEQLCMDGCAVFAECLGGGGIPNCYEDCLEQHGAMEGECLGNYQALTACIIGLTCDELDQFLDEEPEPFPCQAELEGICQEEPCTVGVGMGEEPDECDLEYSCPDEPVYAVACDANGCVCTVDGEQVASCDQAIEVCSSDDHLEALNGCCGWDL